MAGRVTDAETRSTFPGVNGSIVGTMQGPATNADGSYRIDGLEAGTYDVHASPSRLGYTCYEQQGVVYRQL